MKTRSLKNAVIATMLAVAFSASPAQAQDDWTWPVRGSVITRYRNDNAHPYAGGMHRGIDIAAPVGTPVVAARTGEVTYAGNLGSSGLTVAVRTQDGRYVTSYLHLSAISASRGNHIEAGERLGAVGTTGVRSASEPHLHFGVRLADRDDFYVDPLSLLPPLTGGGASAAPVPVPAGAPQRVAEAPLPATRTQAAPRPLRAPRKAFRPLPVPGTHRVRDPLPHPATIAATRARGRGADADTRGARSTRIPLAGPAGRPAGELRHPATVPIPSVRPSGSAGLSRGALLLGALLLALVALGGGLHRVLRRASHVGMLNACRIPHRLRSAWIAATSKLSTQRSPRVVSRIGPLP